VVADPGLLGLERPLARHQADLHAQELVEAQAPLRPPGLLEGLGLVDVPVGPGAVDQLHLVEQRRRQRLLEVAGSVERGADDRPELPGRHVGLPRLRVHRDDHTGLLPEVLEHVDDRVRHLALAPVLLQLAEERGFGAFG
jgi:hypothetical protein